MRTAAQPPVRNRHGSWLFSRHADVWQALRDPRLIPQGQAGPDPATQQWLRSSFEQALSPEHLRRWREDFSTEADGLLAGLPDEGPVDLVQALAEPWSLAVARQVTGAAPLQATRCASLARRLYRAAARATDGRPGPGQTEAAAELATRLAGAASRPGSSVDVQSFVALSQSLPALLSGAWLALLRDGQALSRLLDRPQETACHVAELLRLGSPAQVVFRQVDSALELGGVALQPGERVELHLAAANRDPLQFPEPERIDPARPAMAQLGLGNGTHACAGAGLVRLALLQATQALLRHSLAIRLLAPQASAIRWRGGYAMRAPAKLPVHWQRRR